MLTFSLARITEVKADMKRVAFLPEGRLIFERQF